MSKANKPDKILRTALHRLEKGWKQGAWVPNKDGEGGYCLVGAITGGHGAVTQAQEDALDLVAEAMDEWLADHPELDLRRPAVHQFTGRPPADRGIPNVNDDGRFTADAAREIIKLGIIKAETARLIAEMDDEEVENLIADTVEDIEEGN